MLDSGWRPRRSSASESAGTVRCPLGMGVRTRTRGVSAIPYKTGYFCDETNYLEGEGMEYEELRKSLEKDYLMIKKGRWWFFLGVRLLSWFLQVSSVINLV